MIGRHWHGNRLLVLGFVVFLCLALFFGVMTVRRLQDFDVAKDQPVAAWMTPRYVALSWDVPREVMIEVLQVEPPGPGRETLADIAAGKGIPVADYIATIEAGIAAFRADRGQ